MTIVQSLAAAIAAVEAGFLRRAARAFAKLVPNEAPALARRRVAQRSEPEPEWFRFPPF